MPDDPKYSPPSPDFADTGVTVPSRMDMEYAAREEMNGMSLLQQFFVGRERRRIERDYVRQIISDMYDARYQIIKFQIQERVSQAHLKVQYESDLVKKEMWLDYARGLETISRQIMRQKTDFAIKASEDAISGIQQIETSQKPHLERLQGEFDSGQISQESFDRQSAYIDDQRNMLWSQIQSSQNDMLAALNQQFDMAVSGVRSPPEA